jgi:hypothetical protein
VVEGLAIQLPKSFRVEIHSLGNVGLRHAVGLDRFPVYRGHGAGCRRNSNGAASDGALYADVDAYDHFSLSTASLKRAWPNTAPRHKPHQTGKSGADRLDLKAAHVAPISFAR